MTKLLSALTAATFAVVAASPVAYGQAQEKKEEKAQAQKTQKATKTAGDKKAAPAAKQADEKKK